MLISLEYNNVRNSYYTNGNVKKVVFQNQTLNFFIESYQEKQKQILSGFK